MMSLSVGAMLALGSAGVKLIGKMFGGKTEKVANTVADFVDEAKGAADPEGVLQSRIKDLPIEDLVEFKRIEKEIIAIESGERVVAMQENTKRQAATQETARAEIASSDLYVRHTRPSLARKSFWVGTIYITLTEAIKAILAYKSLEYTGADLSIAAMLYSPLAAYTAGRTAEAFSSKGKTAGGGGLKDILGMATGIINK